MGIGSGIKIAASLRVENMRIFNELYQFAVKLGKFSSANLLEGIETKIRRARILRRVSRIP